MEENVNFPSWIMSKIKYYLSLAFFLSALTGCNTQPISPAQSVGEYYVQATQLSDKPVVVVYQPDLNIYYPSFSMRANETGSVEVSAKIDEIGGIFCDEKSPAAIFMYARAGIVFFWQELFFPDVGIPGHNGCPASL